MAQRGGAEGKSGEDEEEEDQMYAGPVDIVRAEAMRKGRGGGGGGGM